MNQQIRLLNLVLNRDILSECVTAPHRTCPLIFRFASYALITPFSIDKSACLCYKSLNPARFYLRPSPACDGFQLMQMYITATGAYLGINPVQIDLCQPAHFINN
jgi:hypothetical protein